MSLNEKAGSLHMWCSDALAVSPSQLQDVCLGLSPIVLDSIIHKFWALNDVLATTNNAIYALDDKTGSRIAGNYKTFRGAVLVLSDNPYNCSAKTWG